MRGNLAERTAPPGWRRAVVAVLLVALACLLSIALEPWFGMAPLVPFYGAVALAVWYGGVVGAVVTTLLSIVAFGFFVLPPGGSWSLTSDDTARITSFLIFALLLTALSLSRDRVEAELRGSERRFRTMLETANEGIWLVDRDGRSQYANDRMAAMLATSPERLAGASLLDYVFPEDAVAVRAHLAASLAGRAEEFDLRLRRADGQEVRVLVGTSPVRDGAGRIVGVLGSFSDVTARRHAEAELIRANERFALAADAVQSLIYEWDVKTRTVERSAGLLPLLGFRPEEVPSDQAWWYERIHPEDRADLPMDEWARDLQDDRYEREYRLRHRDGRWITAWEQGRVVRDERGEIVRVVGSVTDVTARTEAEQALRLLEDAGRALASSLDYEETLQRVAWLAVPALADWCFVDLVGQDGVIRRVAVAHADPAQADLAARVINFPPTAAVRGPTIEVIETGTPRLIERVEASFPHDVAQSEEHREVVAAFGIVSFISAPLRVGGQVHGAMSLLTTTTSGRRFDADDLALAEQLARRSAVAIQNARLYREAQDAEDRYRGLFEGTKDGIMVFDPAGRCLDANPALTEMSGYHRDELVGNPVWMAALDGPWSGDEGVRLLQEGQWRGEFELRRKDGTTLPVESWITRVSLPSGPAYVGVLRDVSERRRFEQVQEESLSTLAHDLKNPLTTVRGQTQLLLRRVRRGTPLELSRLETGLEAIDAAALRMTRLLDELADVARLRAGQEIELHREPVDLVELARRSVEEYERASERHHVQLVEDVGSLPGFWDGPRLERVLGNLLGNAIKYSPRGGEIIVRIAREGSGHAKEAVLSVSDCGVGIPLADRELIFERYRRAGNVQSIAGSGIGLAGVKRIVELHGGTIVVDSTEGQGSTFTVRLPIAAGDD